MTKPEQPQEREEPKHRKYCRKSDMKCLVYHVDGICPDERDCEACKLEKKEPTQEEDNLDAMVRDFTQVIPRPKSEVRRRIKQELERERNKIMGISVCSAHRERDLSCETCNPYLETAQKNLVAWYRQAQLEADIKIVEDRFRIDVNDNCSHCKLGNAILSDLQAQRSEEDKEKDE